MILQERTFTAIKCPKSRAIRKQQMKEVRLAGCLPLLFMMYMSVAPQAISAQPDYDLMTSWAYHPDKEINLLASYNLDVAVLGPDMETDSVISFENRATENTGVDVFFVHPTYLSGIYFQPGNVDLDEQPIFNILTGLIAQGGLLAKYGRFYAPLYRQATPPTFLGASNPLTQVEALGIAYGDVRSAFLHYLATENGGNDFILAAHSQGSYLLSMLLQDVIAGDAVLKSRMVAAVPAGMVSVYDLPGTGPGAWWDGLELCTDLAQCHCIMTWRSYSEGQTAGMNAGHPAYNSLLVDSSWIHRTIDPSDDWFYQDSLYYGNTSQPLRHYIAPNGGDFYGTGTGFISFDGLYNIHYQRNGPQEMGFFLEHNPTPDDQRPNDLAAEADDPLYDFWGYHRKDYHIYLWALMAQLDAKLEGCSVLGTTNRPSSAKGGLKAFPNPAAGHSIQLQYGDIPFAHQEVTVHGLWGTIIKCSRTNANGSLSLEDLPPGLYLLKSDAGMVKVVVE